MAEFKNVIKQQKRMCEAMRHCYDCPLRSMDSDCRLAEMIDADYDEAEAEAIEYIVMNWAEKHSEQRYPSWEAVWKQLFPKVLYVPCPRMFLPDDRVEYYCGLGCGECRKSPIPADIAEKLEIKPIGGGESRHERDETCRKL